LNPALRGRKHWRRWGGEESEIFSEVESKSRWSHGVFSGNETVGPTLASPILRKRAEDMLEKVSYLLFCFQFALLGYVNWG
jgi:hypothetical protein